MSLSVISLVALAIIVGSIAVAWSRRFLAAGSLLIANILVFALTFLGPKTGYPCIRFGVPDTCTIPTIHAELGLNSVLLRSGDPQGVLQFLSSMFVHADFFHLLGNVIVLLVFALPFEERIGHRRFLLIYWGTGLVGAGAQLAPFWNQDMLLMGASAAIFGIIGAFAASYPNLIVPVPVPVLIIMIFIRMRVWVGGVILGGLQFLYLGLASPFDNTAYLAHIGGLVAGVFVAMVYLRSRRGEEVAKRVFIDFGALDRFAPDDSTRSALKHMQENRDEPTIFQAWMERFFKSARCPECSHPVMPRANGSVVCTHSHTFDVRVKDSG